MATSFGFRYAAIRRPIMNESTHDYVRITVYVAPFTALIPPNNAYNVATVIVPMDDANTMFHFIAWSHSRGVEQEAWRTFNCAQVGIDLDARFRNVRTRENNYLQDRALMKLGDFTGIKGIPNQDIAMWESMGAIADRSKERLGASDLAVVKFRRLMVNAAKTMRDGGGAIGTSKPRIPHAKLAAFEGVVPKTSPWQTLGVAQEELALAKSRERTESAEQVG